MPESTHSRRRTGFAALAAAALLVATLGAPSRGHAELYKYEKPDGSTLITTEKRSDYKLIEVISSGSNAAVSTVNPSEEASSERSKPGRRPEPDARHDETRRENDRETQTYTGPRQRRFDDIIREASDAYDVPVSFIKAVIRVESNFHPNATSHAGAMGLMQLMPKTAAYLNVSDPYDPRQNVFGGTKLLRILIDRYDGDINLILSAYNAGDGAVREYDGIPYRKTRQYVASVFKHYKRYANRYGDHEEESR